MELQEWTEKVNQHRRAAFLAKCGLDTEPQWVGDSVAVLTGHVQALINELHYPKPDMESVKNALETLMKDTLTLRAFYEKGQKPDVYSVEKQARKAIENVPDVFGSKAV